MLPACVVRCCATVLSCCCTTTIACPKGWPFWSITVNCTWPLGMEAVWAGVAMALPQSAAKHGRSARKMRIQVFGDDLGTMAGLPRRAPVSLEQVAQLVFILCELECNSLENLGHALAGVRSPGLRLLWFGRRPFGCVAVRFRT